MQRCPWIFCVGVVVLLTVAPLAAAGATKVSIDGNRWRINGELTHSGSQATGRLMNVRMVNCVFEDVNRPEFDANANTDEFIRRIPEYAAAGVRAFTISLQGGAPGYEGAQNSAFASDGTLRGDYMQRVARVLDACDLAGVAVILNCFYQRQDQILEDADALRQGVRNVARWIADRGDSHVLLEIANEFAHRGFDHDLIRSAAGQCELMRIARHAAPGLLVSTSGLGDGTLPDEIARESDFLLIHFNDTPDEDRPARIAALRSWKKPIVCNEDVRTGEDGARAAATTVAAGASWGLMLIDHNQAYPFRFDGPADDQPVYAAFRRLTSAAGSQGSYFPPSDDEGGWRSLTRDEMPAVAGLDPERLDQAFEYVRGSTPNGGLLVLRHGWLAFERYFGLGHREAAPNLASCGKSITSISVGILLQERPDLFPEGLDQQVFVPELLPEDAFPLSDPRKAEITLGQLLSFTAGIRGNNPSRVNGEPVELDPAGPDGWSAMLDSVALGRRDSHADGKVTSAVTLWCEPGGGYSYATSSVHIASIMLRHVTGQELQSYVDEHLAQPLGWKRWGWGYKTYSDLVHTPGGGGIALRPTDMLRFGFLLLREGRWSDLQIVPAEYVRHATRATVYNPHAPYSLQFDVNTDGHAVNLPRDAFWKGGSGGHVLYVVPSLDLVVWKLGGRDGQYSSSDTGLAVHPRAAQEARPRENWTPLIDPQSATVRTLELVIAALDADAGGRSSSDSNQATAVD